MMKKKKKRENHYIRSTKIDNTGSAYQGVYGDEGARYHKSIRFLLPTFGFVFERVSEDACTIKFNFAFVDFFFEILFENLLFF